MEKDKRQAILILRHPFRRLKGSAAVLATPQQLAAVSILLLLLLPAQAGQHLGSATVYGAYLGCFSLSRMLYLRGVEGKEGKQYTVDTIRQCRPTCWYSGYSMSIITPDYRCWCAISTPDVEAQLEEAACAANSERGAAVFYHHEFAGKQQCRVEALPLIPDNVELSNGSSAVFDDSAPSMTLGLQGSSTSYAAVKGSDMLYGQVEATAMVNAASGGFSTFFGLQSRSSSSSRSDGSSSMVGAFPQGSADRISYQLVTGGSPPVPNSVLLSSITGGKAMGGQLMKPGEYQKRLGLGWNSRVNNTFLDYTISWQSSRVTFAIDGIPLLTRKVGQDVKWSDASNRQFSAKFASPSQPASIHFGVWRSDNKQQQQQHVSQQPAMLPDGLPALSQFTTLKRIVCDQPLSAAARHHRSVRGPPWLYVGKFWDATDDFADAAADVAASSSSDSSSDGRDYHQHGSSSHAAAASSAPSEAFAGFGLHPSVSFGWPRFRVSARRAVRPAPPAPGAALAGKYAGGFSVTLSPAKQLVANIVNIAPAAPAAVSRTTSGNALSFPGGSVDGLRGPRQKPEMPAVPAPASSTVGVSDGSSRPADCRVAVVPLGVCGGAGWLGECLGRRCRDAPWPGHCCKQGFECMRKSSQLWSCERPASCPPSSSSSDARACDWEVSREGVCGGLGSGCEGCQCRDAPWPGFCCAEGLACLRSSRWAWLCA